LLWIPLLVTNHKSTAKKREIRAEGGITTNELEFFFFLIDVGNSPSNAKTTKTCSYKLQRDYVKTHFKQVWQKSFDRKRGAAL
jgi:hypothetical protein